MLSIFEGKAYHYTSLLAATEILVNGEFWLTYIHALNDASEWHYAIESVIAYLKSNSCSETAEYLLRTLNYVNSQSNLHSSSIEANYVLCLSRTADDVSQWRIYGDNAHGVCLEVDVEQLCREDLSLRAFEVSYGFENVKEDVLRFSKMRKHSSSEDKNIFSQEQLLDIGQMFDARGLLYATAFLKHPSFSSENEVRVSLRGFGSYTDEDGDLHMVPDQNSIDTPAKFRVRGRDLVPYVARPFSPSCIRRIICCGTSATLDNVNAMQHFLQSRPQCKHIEIDRFDKHFR